MKLFVAFCLVAVVVADFKAFQEMQGKNYQNLDEASKAKAHYERNMRFIDEHNEKFAAGRVSFSVGENQFTDQNYTEVIARLCKTLPPKDMRNLPAAPQSLYDLPDGPASKDWTSIMQPVADQSRSNCGSCWAFATVAQLESLYRRSARKTYYSLSQQYLVDCSKKELGCNGGWPKSAMGGFLKIFSFWKLFIENFRKQIIFCRLESRWPKTIRTLHRTAPVRTLFQPSFPNYQLKSWNIMLIKIKWHLTQRFIGLAKSWRTSLPSRVQSSQAFMFRSFSSNIKAEFLMHVHVELLTTLWLLLVNWKIFKF